MIEVLKETEYWIVEKDLDKLYIKSSNGNTIEFDGWSYLHKISNMLYEIEVNLIRSKKGDWDYTPYSMDHSPKRITKIILLLDNRFGFIYKIEPICDLYFYPFHKCTLYNQSLIPSESFIGKYTNHLPVKICSCNNYHIYSDERLYIHRIIYSINDQVNIYEINEDKGYSKIIATFEGVEEWKRLYETAGKCKILSSFFILTTKNYKLLFNIRTLKSVEIDYKIAIPTDFGINKETKYKEEFEFIRVLPHYLCIDDKIYDVDLNIRLCCFDIIGEDVTIIDTMSHIIAIETKYGKLYFIEVEGLHQPAFNCHVISYTCRYNSNNEPIASFNLDTVIFPVYGFYFNLALKKFITEKTKVDNSSMSDDFYDNYGFYDALDGDWSNYWNID